MHDKVKEYYLREQNMRLYKKKIEKISADKKKETTLHYFNLKDKKLQAAAKKKKKSFTIQCFLYMYVSSCKESRVF
jgi:hypothetical protein